MGRNIRNNSLWQTGKGEKKLRRRWGKMLKFKLKLMRWGVFSFSYKKTCVAEQVKPKLLTMEDNVVIKTLLVYLTLGERTKKLISKLVFLLKARHTEKKIECQKLSARVKHHLRRTMTEKNGFHTFTLCTNINKFLIYFTVHVTDIYSYVFFVVATPACFNKHIYELSSLSLHIATHNWEDLRKNKRPENIEVVNPCERRWRMIQSDRGFFVFHTLDLRGNQIYCRKFCYAIVFWFSKGNEAFIQKIGCEIGMKLKKGVGSSSKLNSRCRKRFWIYKISSHSKSSQFSQYSFQSSKKVPYLEQNHLDHINLLRKSTQNFRIITLDHQRRKQFLQFSPSHYFFLLNRYIRLELLPPFIRSIVSCGINKKKKEKL